MKYGEKFNKIKNLSKRMYVPEPLDDIKSIVGIHPEFNTVISGRPLRISDDINVYIRTIRSYAMLRQQIGYRNDLNWRIQKNISEELKEYGNISGKIKSHVSNFRLFLLEDHKQVVTKLAKLEKLHAEIQVKNKEFLDIISCVTLLNNVILTLDAARNYLKMYRTYCLFVAPISWRQQYDETLRDRLQSIQFETGVFLLDNDLMDCIDIDKTLVCAKIELRNRLPPVLYFKTPQQMMHMFRGMELQSREYLIQLSHTGAPYRSLQRHVKHLKEATKLELDYFKFNIDYVVNATEREEYNTNYIQQKFFRILNNTFCNTVSSDETLKLKICIEFVYEQVLNKCEDGHHNLYEPMTVIEGLYENYYLNLDALDFKIVESAKRELFSQDLKYMKCAHLAQKELKAFNGMTNALNKALLPPAKFKKLSPLAALPCRKSTAVSKSITVKKCFDLTEDDRDGLLFFTEWVEGTDPAPYLSIYRDQIEPFLAEAAHKFSEKQRSKS
ncbi:uncharacterized protein LOC113227962 [Hyposmocoma kahamanoa]|uniref:uncharacterized protein LOC113227962 n=1 Tax=Hyposmocoma kahamanoa TaxID=1477025 RepID=UPI000E6D8A74|nr:uncharacterized protein LOC113227962 [Hyposmocoma kahamanoa]